MVRIARIRLIAIMMIPIVRIRLMAMMIRIIGIMIQVITSEFFSARLFVAGGFFHTLFLTVFAF